MFGLPKTSGVEALKVETEPEKRRTSNSRDEQNNGERQHPED